MMSNAIKLLSINLFKKNLESKLDDEDIAKVEAEFQENEKRKRYARLFKIKKNGCEEYMLTLSLHERNLDSIKVRDFLNRPSKVIIKNKCYENEYVRQRIY